MATGELYFCHLSIEGSGQVSTIFSALGAGTNALVLALLCADMYWNGFFSNWVYKTLYSGRNLRGKGLAFFCSRR